MLILVCVPKKAPFGMVSRSYVRVNPWPRRSLSRPNLMLCSAGQVVVGESERGEEEEGVGGGEERKRGGYV